LFTLFLPSPFFIHYLILSYYLIRFSLLVGLGFGFWYSFGSNRLDRFGRGLGLGIVAASNTHSFRSSLLCYVTDAGQPYPLTDSGRSTRNSSAEGRNRPRAAGCVDWIPDSRESSFGKGIQLLTRLLKALRAGPQKMGKTSNSAATPRNPGCEMTVLGQRGRLAGRRARRRDLAKNGSSLRKKQSGLRKTAQKPPGQDFSRWRFCHSLRKLRKSVPRRWRELYFFLAPVFGYAIRKRNGAPRGLKGGPRARFCGGGFYLSP